MPIVHRVIVPTELCATTRASAEVLTIVAVGQLFEVLDIAGGLAWGQVSQCNDEGLVGYLPMIALERA